MLHRPSLMHFHLFRTGYMKVHYRHLPVVLAHSTPDKHMLSVWSHPDIFTWLNVLTGVTKIVTIFCLLRYRTTVKAHLSYCFEY